MISIKFNPTSNKIIFGSEVCKRSIICTGELLEMLSSNNLLQTTEEDAPLHCSDAIDSDGVLFSIIPTALVKNSLENPNIVFLRDGNEIVHAFDLESGPTLECKPILEVVNAPNSSHLIGDSMNLIDIEIEERPGDLDFYIDDLVNQGGYISYLQIIISDSQLETHFNKMNRLLEGIIKKTSLKFLSAYEHPYCPVNVSGSIKYPFAYSQKLWKVLKTGITIKKGDMNA